ncbi:amino acid permease [Candidatus Woesearchaeota archaeon]|nr:amino acid permease [Candidatus Woesearchaeota archaeon]
MGLKKVLSFRVILLITINSIMGTGIFFLPAVGAAAAGPASIISWVVLSFIAIYIAMCFGELTSMFPKAGGIYEFCKQAYGRFFSFIIGWMTIIAGNITIAMLVVGAIQYLMPVGSVFLKIGFSLLFIFAFNYIAYKGMKMSAVMLVTFAFITLGTLLALIIPGLLKFQTGNFSPFFVFPTSGILLAIFLIAETFFGWETVTFLAEETKNGAKVMPKALVYGTIAISVICLLSVISSLGVVPWETFSRSATPLADLAVVNYGVWASDVFAILVYLAIIGSVAGWIVSAPRLLLAMAKDKLFLSQLAKVHPKNNTPHRAIIFQTILTTILVIVGAGSYMTLLHLLVPMVLVMYSFVLLSLVILRYKKPHLKRHYRAPFGKVGPIVVVAFMFFLIGMWLVKTQGALGILQLGVSLIFLGIPIYFLIEMYYDPKAIKLVSGFLDRYFSRISERMMYPSHVRKRVLSLLGDIKRKRVLEYGCGVGILTKQLSKEVTKKGKVYATDFSLARIEIAQKRMKNRSRVVVFHHENLDHFKPQIKLPKMDVLVSIGLLGYLQKPPKVLKHLGQKIKKKGRVVFLDYSKFFYLIPNAPWIENEKRVKQIFKEAGFNVEVTKKRGLFWKYVFIHGEKV